MTGAAPPMTRTRSLVWIVVVVLTILHYDFWFWNDRTLVFGFLPIGLLYQALISVAAACCWLLVVKYAWPGHVEEWANAGDPDRESDS